MTIIQKNIMHVRQQIEHAAVQAGRTTLDVQLLAVSKTKPVAQIKEAYMAGQRLFGENYVQESIEKIQLIKDDCSFNDPICWYFIGPLQSNKTRLVAENFDWVQSVDRFKIAQRLSAQRPTNLTPLNICLQINISAEASKSGTTLTQIMELAAQVSLLENLTLRGIMAIPEKTQDQAILSQQFKALHHIYLKLQTLYPEVDTLSMGMSADMQLAIASGSTMVRIGTDIFGRRN
ncbi:alanine racemase domain-containing protein [Psychromonas sp. CNPT3]|uniref:YggS family pyridoxal phosphate-dependent enzyme n=1 Tax=Psychromonas sp. CNPT3 TaxID=314282 RepID=UPI00006E9570|nr:YggS family pyridoxal phosphate-dependent enzyme [Psychromonas sp. CNPT3]AGH80258.1 alanine racemase domain-containing protein [Psychromonas sp. CNPT3]